MFAKLGELMEGAPQADYIIRPYKKSPRLAQGALVLLANKVLIALP